MRGQFGKLPGLILLRVATLPLLMIKNGYKRSYYVVSKGLLVLFLGLPPILEPLTILPQHIIMDMFWFGLKGKQMRTNGNLYCSNSFPRLFGT
ncbi:hypothetical protein MXB_1482 [Myxobolus squamalis]|nr:hypothetical protein MXB_1482 [Myxobolus squamalis]